MPSKGPLLGAVHLPPTVLDAVIPGYSEFAHYILESTGIDISFYVSLGAFGFLLWTGLRVAIIPFFTALTNILSSTATVDYHEEMRD